MGLITPEQLKKERSEFYKIGYKTGHFNLVMFLKENMQKEEFDLYRDKIQNHFDKYPNFMDFLKDEDHAADKR